MLCPHCNTENASAFGYCSSCGKPLSTLDSAPPPPPFGSGTAAGVAPALASQQPKRMSVLALLGVLAVVVLIVFLGISLPVHEKNQTMEDGYRIGRTVTPLLLASALAYVVAGRKKARNPNLFALVFCAVGFIAMGSQVTSSGALSNGFETPDQYVGRLMREAAGQQPVHNSIFPGTRRTDDILRGQFRRIIQANRDYTEAVSKTDISEVNKINSAESFADPQYAAPALQQLHAVYALDSSQEEKVKGILNDMRQALQTQMSSSERESFLRGFDAGVDAQLATRGKAVTAEKAWIDAVDEEYNYAGEHLSDFRLSGSQLVIRDAVIREQFNALLHAQEEKRKSFLAAQQEFAKSQTQLLQKMGVSSQDVGAGK